jgi:hypothetical protein
MAGTNGGLKIFEPLILKLKIYKNAHQIKHFNLNFNQLVKTELN